MKRVAQRKIKRLLSNTLIPELQDEDIAENRSVFRMDRDIETLKIKIETMTSRQSTRHSPIVLFLKNGKMSRPSTKKKNTIVRSPGDQFSLLRRARKRRKVNVVLG